MDELPGHLAMVDDVVEADIEVDGRRWHYYATGPDEAPPVLFVHGFRSSARFFRDAMLCLSDQWRTVAPDLPGHGDSEPWDPNDEVVEQWELLAGFLDAMDLHRLALIGASRGGAVALQLAAHWEGEVTAQVLIAAPTRPFTPGTLDIRRMLVNKEVLTDDLLREMGRTMMASRGYETARRRAVEADRLERDLRPIMGAVTAPTLVIWGSEDRTIPIEMGMELLEGVPSSVFQVIGGSGHVPLLERPEETLALVRAFLARHTLDVD